MFNHLRHAGACVILCLATCTALATIIEIQPTAQDVALGTPASVSVIAGELDDTVIAEFDLLLQFDSTLLRIADVVFGPALGTPSERLDVQIELAAGTLNLASVSLLLDLTDLQTGNGEITLFSIIFDTLLEGVADLVLSPNIAGSNAFFGDEVGQPVAVNSVGGAAISIRGTAGVVEPPLAWLIGLGLIVLLRQRQRR